MALHIYVCVGACIFVFVYLCICVFVFFVCICAETKKKEKPKRQFFLFFLFTAHLFSWKSAILDQLKEVLDDLEHSHICQLLDNLPDLNMEQVCFPLKGARSYVEPLCTPDSSAG